MQEQNFEKQVKKKMEELSLIPSEPVWKKIDAQVRKKRDRRRFFFWLPVAVLLIGGGLWYIGKNLNYNSVIAETKSNTIETGDISTTHSQESAEKNNPANTRDNNSTNTIKKESNFIENENLTSESPLDVNTKKEIIPKPSLKIKEQPSTTKYQPTPIAAPTKQKNDANRKTNSDKTVEISSLQIPDKSQAVEPNKETISENLINNNDSSSNSTDSNSNNIIEKQDEAVKTDTIQNNKSVDKTVEADSVANKKDIATNRKSVSKKWNFSFAAGLGFSGVNNGVGLFGNGAKSMETNAFARDMAFSAPSNSSQGLNYRPPSTQKRSNSFLFGFLARKQVSKRSFLSTGLQYHFYSTRMQVGQKVQKDTIVELNKMVENFYANSGSGFSDFQNNFHFVSLPVQFDYRIINKLPVDLHLGLSLQQLVHTNALMYSANSNVYYHDSKAFNKTYLFSDVGLEYSFPLAKGFVLKAGPRVSYSHSKVIRASDRHLFSYGMVTQLLFSGN